MDRPPPGIFSKFFIEPCICRTDIMSDVHVSRAPFPVTAEPLVNRQQDVKFDFTADLTGTGDRSVNVIPET